jgi:hypothetical protein
MGLSGHVRCAPVGPTARGTPQRGRHYVTYIGPPNGPIQRTNPVRYVQHECYETTANCGVRNTKIGPRATRALPRLKNVVLKVVKMGT